MRRVLPVVGLLTLFMFIAGCAASQATEAPTPTPLPTAVKPTFTVQRGEIVIKTTLGGRVAPVNSKPANFAMDGNIGTVYVQEGDYVEPGQLLADLEALKDLESEWGTASAQAKYEETLSNNTIKRAEIKLQIAQLNVADLKAKGATQTAIQMAELQAQLAQMDLDEVKANPTLHTALAKVQELEQAMAAAQLKAPIAGYIVGTSASGRAVKKTTDAFLIGDIKQLEISIGATDEDLKQLTEGQTVTVVFEGKADKQPHPGVIRQLPYPYGSGGNGDTDVRVTLTDAAQSDLKLGDRALMTVVLQDKSNILWLPPGAIRTVGGRTFVVVQTPKGQQRVDVTLGLQTHDRVEITAGVTDGQVVVGP